MVTEALLDSVFGAAGTVHDPCTCREAHASLVNLGFSFYKTRPGG